MRKKILVVGMVMLVCAASLALVGRLYSESDTVVAKIGEVVITQGDLDEYLQKNAAAKRGQPYTPEEKKAMLDNLAKFVVVSLEAEKDKMDQTPAFKSRLKVYRLELLVQDYFLKKVQPGLKVSDEEMEKMLKESGMVIPEETLHLKEIMVSTEKEADAIYEELQKGASFGTIALAKSKAETRVNGGNMKPASRGQLPKELEAVAFTLKPGELSKPIKTEKGYYILLLTDKKVRTPEEMNKLRAQMKAKMMQVELREKGQRILDEQAKELLKKANAEIYFDRIQ
jgi:peptidyl-prolyl cis-trans isomerase C